MEAARFVAEFTDSPQADLWEGAAYFPAGKQDQAEQFVRNMVGSNPKVQRGRVFDFATQEPVFEIGKEELRFTVRCFDTRSLRAHFSEVEAASDYANRLLRSGHKAKIYPYQPPKTYVDYLAEEGL